MNLLLQNIKKIFLPSSIPSKGKYSYIFSARSEKTVCLNALKCSASLNNLFYSWEIFKVTYKVLGSGEFSSWG